MNLRQLLSEIRTSPVRARTHQRYISAIKKEARMEMAAEFSCNPTMSIPTPSKFTELFAARKTA